MITFHLKPKEYVEGTEYDRLTEYDSVSVDDNGLEFYETDTDILWRVCAGAWLAINVGGGGGSTTFTGLTDTPASFAGAGGQLVAVNGAANALEFVDLPSHNIVGASHTVTGSQWDVVGLTATNTVGVLTPASDPAGANVVLLRTNTSGNINLQSGLTFNAAATISTTAGALTLQPLAGQSLNVNLSTTGDFIVNTDDLVVDTSTGRVGIGTVPAYGCHIAPTTNTAAGVSVRPVLSGSPDGSVGVDIRPEIQPVVSTVLFGALYLPQLSTTANNVTTMYGQYNRVDLLAGYSGAVTNLRTLGIVGPVISGGSVTNLVGLYITDMTVGGTSNHSIYTNAGDIRLMSSATDKIGFHGSAPVAKQTITGSKGGNAALTSLMTALANLGLVVNSTT